MDSSELKAQGDPSKVAPHSPEFSLQAAPRVLTVKTGAAPLTCDSQGSSHRDAGLDGPPAEPASKGEGVLELRAAPPQARGLTQGLGEPREALVRVMGSRGDGHLVV